MPCTAAPPPWPVFAWWEIGRPWPGEAADWATWVAPLSERGAALYRVLVVADGAITVSVDLHLGHTTQAVHRGRCGLPGKPEAIAERVRLLLIAADEAARRALEAQRREGAAADRGKFCWREGAPSQGERPDGALDARPELERRLRERAYLLWEREGRPEGRAEEFWERACQEELCAA